MTFIEPSNIMKAGTHDTLDEGSQGTQSMTYDETKAKLIEVIVTRLAATGKDVPSLEETTMLLGDSLPIDSLELAVIVIHMAEITGNDPFASGFVEFQTLGELARLYAC